jgi:uncharacterized protein (DUF1501 family)
MNLSRREFMIGCSAAIAGMSGARFSSLAFAPPSQASTAPILIVIFLRGGMDGLHFVGPAGDKDYVAARGPELRVAESGAQAGLALKNALPGGDFRMHPKASALHELYTEGDLAIVHACGLPNATRSHFEAMDLMERGVADMASLNLSSGWLTRILRDRAPSGPIQAVSMGGEVDASLLGFSRAAAVPDLGSFILWGGKDQFEGLKLLYGTGDSWIHTEGRKALGTVEALAAKIPRKADNSLADYTPSHGAKYPDNGLGHSMRDLARLLKSDIGLQACTVDYGGWDTHQDQSWQFSARLEELSSALHAFYTDMTDQHSRLTVVVKSEFGRRVKSNQSNGTDHGHGNAMMVLGKGIKGGRMYGRWPGLNPDQLDERADLAITTDYRRVLAEVLKSRMGVAEPDKFFPLWKPEGNLGICG